MKNWFHKYLPITFDAKLFLILVLGFIVATVVGTMSYALGYYLIGETQGHEVIINYRGAFCYDELPHSLLFSASGILTPIIIGSIGLIVLFLRRKTFIGEKLLFGQWILIFIAMFLLRQSDNFAYAVLRYFVTGKFRCQNADTYIAELLNLPIQSIQLTMVAIGLIVLSFIVFRFIPKNQRFTFLLAGIVGGIGGYYLWFYELGKKILP